jgi:RND family efflux transporter MFP subunit
MKALAGLLVIAAACLGIEEMRRRAVPVVEAEIVRPVRTIALEADSGSQRRYFGSVQGSRRVNLSFRVHGTLQELAAEKGAAVKKGDLLARIDARDFRTKVAQAQGVLAQARAQYSDAAANFRRYEELYQQKVIAAAKYDAYKAQLSVARSAVSQAEAHLAAARDALRDTELRAPFDGVVAERMAENFQDVIAKQPLIVLQDISELEIVFSVPDTDVLLAPVPASADMKQLSRLSASFGVKAHFDAIPDREFPVKLKEFAAQADPRTKTYPVTVTLPQPEGVRVLPGMAVTVTVDFSGGDRKNTFLVPESAILSRTEGDSSDRSVWLYRDGAATLVPVIVNGERNGMIEISSPKLNVGDRVVTAGVHFLREGQKVRLMKEGERQ